MRTFWRSIRQRKYLPYWWSTAIGPDCGKLFWEVAKSSKLDAAGRAAFLMRAASEAAALRGDKKRAVLAEFRAEAIENQRKREARR